MKQFSKLLALLSFITFIVYDQMIKCYVLIRYLEGAGTGEQQATAVSPITLSTPTPTPPATHTQIIA
jgi:hypothetical protein